MRRTIFALDALATLREAASAHEVDLTAAATLAELAGADAVRLGIVEELVPMREEDVYAVRRVVRCLELRMPPSQGLLKVALEARPDRVLLAGDSLDGRTPGVPLDLGGRGVALAPVLRALTEAGIEVGGVVAPQLEAVKAAHAEGFGGVELYTATLLELRPAERAEQQIALGDAVRLAAKLHMRVGVAGGIGYRAVRELVDAAPAIDGVTVGRAAVARAQLVGVDRALRDLRALVTA